ncbi:P-II family nitrogen regulator [Thiomicrolovo sp. ZZH C-3]
MYQLTAIFNRSCLSDVLLELKERAIEGVTISEVIGKGGVAFDDAGPVELDENIRLDIVVSNERFKEAAKEAIRCNTRDLGKGSGKMWVTPVLEVERIRTGEINEAALRHNDSDERALHFDSYYTAIDTPAS